MCSVTGSSLMLNVIPLYVIISLSFDLNTCIYKFSKNRSVTLSLSIESFCVKSINHFVQHLECLVKAPHYRQLPGLPPEKRIKVAINPRYDYQEVWLWLWDILEFETKNVDLSEQWENALSQVV